MATESFWTAERTKILRAGCASGLSYGRIAAKIGDGCTKNMVLAKATRLRLTNPNSRITAAPTWRRIIALTDADMRGCRYIAGDPTPLREGMFCGQKTAGGLPYCEKHQAICCSNRVPLSLEV